MKRITSLGALVAGLVVGLAAPPALAAQGTLAGTWSSIDTDGSSQTLTVTGSGNGAYAMSLFDDAATLCGGAPARATGSGRVEEDRLLSRVSVVCLPGGNLLRGVIGIGYTYDAGADTLTDDFGVVWSRG
ncbi:hypothetical protein ASG88_16175 [Nocardioides sp. Soil777]|uniref:hypothetical protein n=1 Tax=Nocardioides sp. Soil777 TaxID=1736409 RepID=UPI000702B74F|nr:hypothetical protein [Nocardioides sp. Soil777]KRE99256.1 hypothetical protein ASG88_16175 [Nocardioides sp. Soil777]